MAKFAKLYLAAVDRANEYVGRVATYLIYFICLIVVIDVTLRYVFNDPAIWGQEATLFFFGAYFMLGVGYNLLHKRHVRVEIVYQYLPQRLKKIIDFCSSAFVMFFAVLLFWQGGWMFVSSFVTQERSPSMWGPLLYPYKIFIPIAAALLMLQVIAEVIRDILAVNETKERMADNKRSQK